LCEVTASGLCKNESFLGGVSQSLKPLHRVRVPLPEEREDVVLLFQMLHVFSVDGALTLQEVFGISYMRFKS
jgi:hypothetical protein